jgi:hypothetical protein
MRAALAGALLAGAGWGGTWAMTHAAEDAFARRIDLGCEELEPCQRLEAEAERRLEECSLSCGRAAAEYRATRLMRYRAEERRAVRDHYRERERAEQLERQGQRERQLDDWQRREAARADEAARDRQHELELERLRQAHADRRLAEERQRRQNYYAALGSGGRAQRLKHCLTNSERCDALVLELLEATRDDTERRKLAELNEGLTHPSTKDSHDEKAPAEPRAEEALASPPPHRAPLASPSS